MRKITEREWNKVLREHLERYYKKRKIARMETKENLLGQSQFKKVYFKNGTYITFSKGAVLKNGKPFWIRHSGGGRYGLKREYEGRY